MAPCHTEINALFLTRIPPLIKKSAQSENRAALKREILFGEKMADKDINPGYTQTPARRALKGNFKSDISDA
jgi:hypothetical protein